LIFIFVITLSVIEIKIFSIDWGGRRRRRRGMVCD
jgi:hypothetical protein